MNLESAEIQLGQGALLSARALKQKRINTGSEMRTIIATVLAISTASCGTATMVKTPYPWLAYAPANQASEVGTVSYKNRRPNSEVDSGRFSAYKLMHQICRGDYVTVGNPYSPYPKGGWRQDFRDHANGLPPSPIYIDFQCVAD